MATQIKSNQTLAAQGWSWSFLWMASAWKSSSTGCGATTVRPRCCGRNVLSDGQVSPRAKRQAFVLVCPALEPFGVGVEGLATALVAFLKGKATPSGSPRFTALPNMLYKPDPARTPENSRMKARLVSSQSPSSCISGFLVSAQSITSIRHKPVPHRESEHSRTPVSRACFAVDPFCQFCQWSGPGSRPAMLPARHRST